MSRVLAVPTADPADAAAVFARRLAVETDPSDVHADLTAGVPGLVVVDCRSPEAYAAGHVPGAVSMPWATITGVGLDPAATYVTYCWSESCNAGDRGALALARLGLRVKLMLGGVAGWQREGYPLVR